MFGSLGSARGSIFVDVAQARSNVAALAGDLRAFSSSAQSSLAGLDSAVSTNVQSLQSFSSSAKSSLTGFSGFITANEQSIRDLGGTLTAFGTIATGVFGAGVWNAANVEQAFSIMEVNTGAAGEQLDALKEKALQLGKDTVFSTSEAAAAITELGKAGMSVETILGGAADAVVNLAVAGEMDLASAASVLTATMNQFGLSAEQATFVVDTLARGAAVSTADLADLAQGLTYVGTTANQLGFPIEDVTAALAALNDQGIRGSMAGTSLNQMLTSLINPTGKAKTAMDELGLSFGQTYSVINDDGTMKSLPEILSNVDQATKGLTETERARYLNMVFGEQGGRAINALLQTQTEEAKAAGKGWEDYAEGVVSGNTAADMAAGKMNNLKGDFEQLKGGLETLAYTATNRLLPALRFIVQGADSLIAILISLPEPIQATIAALVGIGGATSLAAGGFLLMLPKINDTYKALNELKKADGVGRAISGLIGPMKGASAAMTAFRTGGLDGLAKTPGLVGRASSAMLDFTGSVKSGDITVKSLAKSMLGLAKAHPILAGLSIAAALYATNFLGIRDAVENLAGRVRSVFSDMAAAFRGTSDEASIAAEDVASFAEATKVVDGKTVYTAFVTNADGTKREVGEIVESYANADGTTAQVLIRGEDGEYWATIDLATGTISNAEIPVTADTRSFTQKIDDALNVLKERMAGSGFEFAIPLVTSLQALLPVVASVASAVGGFLERLNTQFQMFAQTRNPLAALVAAIAATLSTIDFGPFQSVMDGVVGALQQGSLVIQEVGNAIGSVFSGVAALWQGHWSDAK